MKLLIYDKLREKFRKILNENKIENTVIKIKTKVLTPQESIGNPIHDDYPLVKGRERLIQADFNGSKGVAFTDMYGDYEGMLYEVVNMELKNNFRRAIFVAALNAVLRHLMLVENTLHCKDEGLLKCAEQLKSFIAENYSGYKILLVGHQPRFSEVLTENFKTKIVDMDPKNANKIINEVKIETEDKTDELIIWADLLFVTGSTFVNATADRFILPDKETVFYGVTCAGPAYLLDLKRYCLSAL